MKIVPINLKQAQDFVNEHHRHNVSPQGHKFSIGLENDGVIVGVAIAGRPVARKLDDGRQYHVECENCGILVQYRACSLDMAIKLWNDMPDALIGDNS